MTDAERELSNFTVEQLIRLILAQGKKIRQLENDLNSVRRANEYLTTLKIQPKRARE